MMFVLPCAHPTLRQLISFSFVGGTAAFIHLLSAIFIVEIFKVSPLIANCFAFVFAFQASYFGQKHWTFRKSRNKHSVTFPRFLTLQLGGFLFNECLLFIFTHIFIFDYISSLIVVIAITAFITFFLSKLWVFKE